LWRDLTSCVPTNPGRRHPGKHPILPVGVAHSSSEKPVQPRGWGGRAWGALRGPVCTAHAGSARGPARARRGASLAHGSQPTKAAATGRRNRRRHRPPARPTAGDAPPTSPLRRWAMPSQRCAINIVYGCSTLFAISRPSRQDARLSVKAPGTSSRARRAGTVGSSASWIGSGPWPPPIPGAPGGIPR